jgi:hypothetical protein
VWWTDQPAIGRETMGALLPWGQRQAAEYVIITTSPLCRQAMQEGGSSGEMQAGCNSVPLARSQRRVLRA